jgi:thiol-disulfide isomerase/thioredoxin
MQKKWLNLGALLILAVIGYYFYQKYRVAPELKTAQLPIQTLDGNDVSLARYQGQKTALCFAASWCGPCRQELKMIGELKSTTLKDVKIVVISDEDPLQIERLKMQFPFDFEWLRLKQPFASIGINSIPTSYLLNRQGRVVKQKVGAIDWEDPSTANYHLGLMD